MSKKGRKKTAVVCFFFVRNIKLKFRGYRSQAAETYQTGRRQNNIARSKLFQEAKQFPESAFVLNWPNRGMFDSRKKP